MGNYTDTAAAIRVSVVAEVFGFLVLFFIELSMMFQVRIVCVNLSAIKRRAITCSSICVALTVCTIRFTLMIVNADWSIVHGNDMTEQQKQTIDKLGSVSNITTIVSIIFFNVIFVTKLGIAIKHRHSMGMKQFGPMQIIFVMGCQTLFIPGKSSHLPSTLSLC
jgi:pheromone alpha factor receptor